MRTIKCYSKQWSGYGCVEYTIQIDESKIISETPVSITIEGKVPYYDDEVDGQVTYITNIDEFIRQENEWFDTHINEITSRHKHTLKIAEKFKIFN